MPLFYDPAYAVLRALALAIGFCLVALAMHSIALRILRRVLRSPKESFLLMALGLIQNPTRLGAMLLSVHVALTSQPLPEAFQVVADKTLSLVWVGALAWGMLAAGGILMLWLQRSYDILSENNLHARKVLTQVRMFRRIFSIVVCVVALSATLMIFDATRNLGASVLASAGIAGAVAGLSAQKFLSTIFAGMQIALTQPIRLDDVVVVEGEWGRVEEITLTYVVVCIWDQRRLVVPVMYFLDKPIANWTRNSAKIMGTVFLQVDYRAPVAALRTELERICREEGLALWDGQVCGLQVTEAGAATLELRALVSSANSSLNWDLRCLVRERLVAYVRDVYPESLPQARILLPPAPDLASKEHTDEEIRA